MDYEHQKKQPLHGAGDDGPSSSAQRSNMNTTTEDSPRPAATSASSKPLFKLFGGSTTISSSSGGGGCSEAITTHQQQKRNDRRFEECYKLGRVLGCGSFSTVRLAVDRATGEQWACKIVTEVAARAVLLREVHILLQLDHPNLLRYREHFDTASNLIIITELLEGPDLLVPVLERGSYSEDDAREVMRQVLHALAYLDSKGVAHRDLKMENIMLITAGDNTSLKIIDFGLADQLPSSHASSSLAYFEDGGCGTPSYIAPEVASCVPYTTKCDVWAAGVILFMLLSGDFPFQGATVSELMLSVRKAKPHFTDPVWEITSPGAKGMVETLLTGNSAVRVSAEEALTHPWLIL